MKIKSNFKDYYDYILPHHYQSNDIIFNRYEKIISSNEEIDEILNNLTKYKGNKFIYKDVLHNFIFYRKNVNTFYDTYIDKENNYIDVYGVIICICGKVKYLIQELNKKEKIINNFFSIEKYLHHLSLNFKKGIVNTSLFRTKYNDIDICVERFLKNKLDTLSDKYFIKYKTPIIIIIPLLNEYRIYNKMIINAKLNDFGLQKILLSFEIYQMIEIYLSSILLDLDDKEKTIPDKYKIEQKGFNRFSFRKERKR